MLEKISINSNEISESEGLDNEVNRIKNVLKNKLNDKDFFISKKEKLHQYNGVKVHFFKSSYENSLTLHKQTIKYFKDLTSNDNNINLFSQHSSFQKIMKNKNLLNLFNTRLYNKVLSSLTIASNYFHIDLNLFDLTNCIDKSYFAQNELNEQIHFNINYFLSYLVFLSKSNLVSHITMETPFELQNFNARVRMQSGYIDSLVHNFQDLPNNKIDQELEPFKTIGLNGKNQICGVADSGANDLSCFLLDNSNNYTTITTSRNGEIQMNRRKIIQYVPYADSLDDMGGHGTHVCSSIVGNSFSDYGKLDALASEAKITFFDIGVTNKNELKIPAITTILKTAYEAGARIHSNSWGNFIGIYGLIAREVDKYLYYNEDMLVLFAAGNYGHIGKSTISTPANSKNVVAIGATKLKNNKNDYNIKKDESSISFFSSLGPTYDKRIKPDISAPGDYILSAYASSPSSLFSSFQSNWKGSDSCSVHQMSGTSMATPQVASAALIIRQYFMEDRFWNSFCLNKYHSTCSKGAFEPSGSLMKALLIHSGDPVKYYNVIKQTKKKIFELEEQNTELSNQITSTKVALSPPPDNYQGYGELNLLNILPLKNSEPVNLFLWEKQEIKPFSFKKVSIFFPYNKDESSKNNIFNSTRNKSLNSTTSVKYFKPIKITLSWYDPPHGVSFSRKVLINDLDLFLETPNNFFYLGNKRDSIYYPQEFINYKIKDSNKRKLDEISQENRNYEENSGENSFMPDDRNTNEQIYVAAPFCENLDGCNYNVYIQSHSISGSYYSSINSNSSKISNTQYPTSFPTSIPIDEVYYGYAYGNIGDDENGNNSQVLSSERIKVQKFSLVITTEGQVSEPEDINDPFQKYYNNKIEHINKNNIEIKANVEKNEVEKSEGEKNESINEKDQSKTMKIFSEEIYISGNLPYNAESSIKKTIEFKNNCENLILTTISCNLSLEKNNSSLFFNSFFSPANLELLISDSYNKNLIFSSNSQSSGPFYFSTLVNNEFIYSWPEEFSKEIYSTFSTYNFTNYYVKESGIRGNKELNFQLRLLNKYKIGSSFLSKDSSSKSSRIYFPVIDSYTSKKPEFAFYDMKLKLSFVCYDNDQKKKDNEFLTNSNAFSSKETSNTYLSFIKNKFSSPIFPFNTLYNSFFTSSLRYNIVKNEINTIKPRLSFFIPKIKSREYKEKIEDEGEGETSPHIVKEIAFEDLVLNVTQDMNDTRKYVPQTYSLGQFFIEGSLEKVEIILYNKNYTKINSEENIKQEDRYNDISTATSTSTSIINMFSNGLSLSASESTFPFQIRGFEAYLFSLVIVSPTGYSIQLGGYEWARIDDRFLWKTWPEDWLLLDKDNDENNKEEIVTKEGINTLDSANNLSIPSQNWKASRFVNEAFLNFTKSSNNLRSREISENRTPQLLSSSPYYQLYSPTLNINPQNRWTISAAIGFNKGEKRNILYNGRLKLYFKSSTKEKIQIEKNNKYSNAETENLYSNNNLGNKSEITISRSSISKDSQKDDDKEKILKNYNEITLKNSMEIKNEKKLSFNLILFLIFFFFYFIIFILRKKIFKKDNKMDNKDMHNVLLLQNNEVNQNLYSYQQCSH